MNIVIIIPARGGSKGIPRKNLRNLGGYPLIYYSIKTALSSKLFPDVFLSSEDEEICSIAAKYGAMIHKRKPEYASDNTTLDPVIYHAYKYAEQKTGKTYDIVVTLQPTSPLLTSESLDKAIQNLIDTPSIDTIISAKDDTHLRWKKENNRFVPDYTKRLNRQYLPPSYCETGGFFISRASIITPESRIGINVDLYLLSEGEEIDIDTYEDWHICKYYLDRKTVLFVLTGYAEVGLGHVYRALTLANFLTSYRLVFLVDNKSYLALKKLKENNYEVYMQQNANIIEDINDHNPDIIINDILDTRIEYMKTLKTSGYRVINFEDLGEGAKHADAVINALYEPGCKAKNLYSGYKYFCARDEFLATPIKEISEKVQNVLITFGGTDQCNLTLKVITAIKSYCHKHNIKITVILGLGYDKVDTLSEYKDIEIFHDVKSISDHMYKADIIFTSGGRTVYEAACIGTPVIVLSQNQRELTHNLVRSDKSLFFAGYGPDLKPDHILHEFRDLVNNFNRRKEMSRQMLSKNLRIGTRRVVKILKRLIEE
jgi:CMP-N-acetylneuraminic acid synthetase